MVHVIESVTLAVADPPAALRLFRDQLGLRVAYDARASVGLLSAWRYPVHEAVRLIELAPRSSSEGRVRLAIFEDAVLRTPRHAAALEGSLPPLRTGPLALDFRAGTKLEAILAGSTIAPLEGSSFALLSAMCGGGTPAADPGALSAVWIRTSDLDRAAHFCSLVLGYESAGSDDLRATDAQELQSQLGLSGVRVLRIATFRAPTALGVGIALLETTLATPSDSCRGLGAPGINLLTCRCDDLDAVLARLNTFGLEPNTAPLHVGLPDGRRGRVLTVAGPNGELFELIEDAD